MNSPWGIHWFRRDLRLAGNEALELNLEKTKGKTLGLFCFDSKFLSRSDFSHNRFAFFLKTNNGGWQWAASTGCDPQPYFRIFNPWLQGKKFDPDGEYIKKFIPELRKAPGSALHDPEADRSAWNYPAPIVDHFEQKAKALKLYKK